MDNETPDGAADASSIQPAHSAAGQDLRTPAPSSPSTRDFSGTTLGDYQLVRLIAEGGMGVVYEAIQLKLARRVALKILSEELASQPEFVQRFQREARAAGALNHPNMVQVHDFGEAQGWCYLVMEYVDGQDLADYTEEHGKLTVLAALDIVEQAAHALKAAGEKSIIHRDIKPSNLMLTRDGRVKISDLGLSKNLTEASDLTLTGIGMGSPYFMAPEQASDARGVDHRADIYALGLTLLFLLTGKRPYDGTTPYSVILAHANQPLPSGIELGTELPDEVEALVKRMAAKNPGDRYADYDLLIEDLRRVKAGYVPLLTVATPRRGFRIFALAGAGLGLALVVAAAFFWGSARRKTIATQAGTPPARPLPERLEPPPGPINDGDAQRQPEPFDRGNRPPPEREGEFDNGPEPARRGLLLPMGRLPRPNQSPLKDGPVETMLVEARRYAAQHPQDYRDLVDRYRQVLAAANGTPQAQLIDQELNDVISRHQPALREAIKTYEAKMQEKIRAGKPQEAYDVWKDFPPGLRTFESDQQIQQSLERSLPRGFAPR